MARASAQKHVTRQPIGQTGVKGCCRAGKPLTRTFQGSDDSRDKDQPDRVAHETYRELSVCRPGLVLDAANVGEDRRAQMGTCRGVFSNFSESERHEKGRTPPMVLYASFPGRQDYRGGRGVIPCSRKGEGGWRCLCHLVCVVCGISSPGRACTLGGWYAGRNRTSNTI
ncbi:hypothetical protein Bbelb_013680 [Branchiostoma belcheri]|nr:hypothetical protein Bbelb_013680 [Branchiostoma belcheri]